MRSHALAWLLLAASIAAEVVGTIALRYADGFTRLWPSLAVGSLYALAIWLMSLSVQHLEVGLAYAVWAGVGTILAWEGGAPVSTALAWCWVIASGGAWLLEVADIRGR